MLKTSILASLLAALSAAELHIYDVRDTAYTPDTDYEWTGILEFIGPPDCNDARGRSGYIAEEDGDATYLGARCKGCSPITDTYADLDIEELEWNNGDDHHFTLRRKFHICLSVTPTVHRLLTLFPESEGYQIEPADGSPLRGYCWRDSDDSFDCVNGQGNSLSGTRLFICDTDLQPYES